MSAAVPPAGWGISSRAHSAFQSSRSSARSIDAGDVPTTSSRGSVSASFSGVCPPRDTITPTGVLGLDDVHHVLVGERLEVEPVGGVVVGRHRLGVAVDHDRLEAGVAQGEAGVHAAVVELDALADAVGSGAEDDDLGTVRGDDLVVVLVGRVVVRRLPPRTRRRRCRRSCRSAPPRRPCGRRARRPPATPQSYAELGVGEPEPLGPAPRRRGSCAARPTLGEVGPLLDDGEHLVEEPRVDLGGLVPRRRR